MHITGSTYPWLSLHHAIGIGSMAHTFSFITAALPVVVNHMWFNGQVIYCYTEAVVAEVTDVQVA